MRSIKYALITSAIIALPTTFMSMSVASLPNTSYFDYLVSFRIWLMIIQIFVWCFIGAFAANMLMLSFTNERINSVYLKAVFALISSFVAAIVMAYISTTLYQSLALARFTSIGTFPHSWTPYLAALKSYFLCGFVACILTLLIIQRKYTNKGSKTNDAK